MRAQRRRDLRRAGAGVLAVLAATVVLIALLSRTDRPPASPDGTSTSSSSTTLNARQRREQRTAQAFRDRMQKVFTELVSRFPAVAKDLDAFDSGTMDVAGFRSVHGAEVDLAERARDELAGVEGLAGEPRPKRLYAQSAALYAEAFRAFRDATEFEQPLRHQLILHGKRIRTLADRVFDRGSRIVERLAHDADNPDLEVHLPEEVPDWGHEGFAAGPPVGSTTENHVTIDESKAKRPEQSQRGWTAAMATVTREMQRNARTSAQLATGGNIEAAAAAADRFEAVAERARRIADPRGRREAFTAMRLAILVEAESARGFALARAALEATGARPVAAPVVDAIRQRARDLALVADTLWSYGIREIGAPARLKLPATGFDRGGLGLTAP